MEKCRQVSSSLKQKNYTQALDLYEKSYKFDSQNPVTVKQRQKLRKILNY